METLEIARSLCYTEFMKYDYVTLYNKHAAFWGATNARKRLLKIGNVCLTWLFMVCYGGFWVYSLTKKTLETGDMVKLLFIPLLALLTVSILRIFIERPRPYAEEGAGITPMIDKEKADKKSFPSRHLTCAAVISIALLPFYAWMGIGLLAASLLLGYTRFALGLHYPTDLLAGEALGLVFGCLIFIL